jgi:xylulokinase
MGRYLAGVDVGTSGSRCSLFDVTGRRMISAECEYDARYPKPGWVEQDPQLLVDRTMAACRRAIEQSGVSPNDIASIGFSTQRSITCAVDKHGVPLRWLISWQDARTAAQVEQLRRLMDAEDYYHISGLPLGTTWILTKILWMREYEPELFQRTAKFVQGQDLILRAFGAEDDYTDISGMAFYGVWDVGRLAFNEPLLNRLGLSSAMFGKPTPAGTQVAQIGRLAAERTGFAVGTPVCVGAGDQNCSVIGMGAIHAGMATVTLGTAGLAVLCSDRPVEGFGGMMITNHAAPNRWEVEGLSNAAASSLRWFRDLLNTAGQASPKLDLPDSQKLDLPKSELSKSDLQAGVDYPALSALGEQSPPGARGLLYLPYLATAATPRWNPDARAVFLGLSLAHSLSDITRAIMEGVVLEIRDIMEQWHRAGMKVEGIRIGGGAVQSPLWCQIQADIFGRPVELLECEDSTGLGSALLGGVGAGVFASIEEGVEAMVRPQAVIEPRLEYSQRYSDLYQAYVLAYEGLQQSGAFQALARMQALENHGEDSGPGGL